MIFAKGDRVICTSNFDGAITEGRVGTVIQQYGEYVSIEFDIKVLDEEGYVCGHSGFYSVGRHEFCWDVYSDYVQPYFDLPTVVCGDMSMLFGATGGI